MQRPLTLPRPTSQPVCPPARHLSPPPAGKFHAVVMVVLSQMLSICRRRVTSLLLWSSRGLFEGTHVVVVVAVVVVALLYSERFLLRGRRHHRAAVVVRGVKGAPYLYFFFVSLWRLAFNVACSLCVSSNEHSSYTQLLSRIPNHQLCSTTCATVQCFCCC